MISKILLDGAHILFLDATGKVEAMTPLDESGLALHVFPNSFKDAYAFGIISLRGSVELVEEERLIDITVQPSKSVLAFIVDDLSGPVIVNFVDLIRFVRRLVQLEIFDLDAFLYKHVRTWCEEVGPSSGVSG